MDPDRSLLRCPSCGQLNDPSARFCRNCGLPLGWPQDPVRGTTTRRADLPSERGAGSGAIVGLVAAVAVLATALFLIFRSGADTGSIAVVSPSPTPIGSPVGSAGPSAFPTSGSSVLPSPGGSAAPQSAPPSSQPTDTPVPSATPAASFSPATGFTCGRASIFDPTNSRWHVSRLNWKTTSRFDEAIITLTRDGPMAHGPVLTIESMTPSAVSTRFGLTPPAGGRAVVVSFDRNARTSSTIAWNPSSTYPVLRDLRAAMDSHGLLHIVLGVTGSGCYDLSAPGWKSNPTATTVDILIDVKPH